MKSLKNKNRVYLSTTDGNAYALSEKYGLDLELIEYATAWNLDRNFEQTNRSITENRKETTELILHGPFSELYPCAIDPRIREVCKQRFLQTIEVAGRYACKKIVFHGGYNPYLYYPIWYQEQSPDFWRDLLSELPEDISIYAENVFETDPAMLADIIRQVDDTRLRMCLDIGHANAYSKIPVSAWIRECRDVIRHFHVHNNNGNTDSHSPITEGTIPIREILDQISVECPDASITLELIDAESSLQTLIREGFI